MMKLSLVCAVTAASTVCLLSADAAEIVKPVRMGSGTMTFDTVPGWGLGDDGKSVIGATHGGVTIDKAGNIYTSADIGVFED